MEFDISLKRSGLWQWRAEERGRGGVWKVQIPPEIPKF
jgi:hypothetical protein